MKLEIYPGDRVLLRGEKNGSKARSEAIVEQVLDNSLCVTRTAAATGLPISRVPVWVDRESVVEVVVLDLRVRACVAACDGVATNDLRPGLIAEMLRPKGK